MKHTILFILTFTSLSVCSADWQECPKDISEKALVEWRSALTERVLANDFAAPVKAIAKCFPEEVPACYEDLTYYADLKSNPDAYEKSNRNLEETTLTSRDQLPKEFWGERSKSDVIIPKNILELAKEKNWKTVLYKTRSSGGFDHAPNLFMIAVPGPEVDIFLQTSPHPDANARDRYNNPIPNPSNGDITQGQETLTMITVDKTKKPPEGQLRIMLREQGVYQWVNVTRTSSCQGCHSLPLKPISPLGYKVTNGEKKMGKEQSKDVDEMNILLGQYVTWGTTNFNGKKVRLGPAIDSQPLGWAPKDSETRTEAFINSCAVESGKIDTKKIASAMNCTDCHNNSFRGILHEGFGPSEIEFKIKHDRSMPYDYEQMDPNWLTDKERKVLYECLYKERDVLRDKWKKSGDWMKRSDCGGKQFNKPPVMNKAGSSQGVRNSNQQ